MRLGAGKTKAENVDLVDKMPDNMSMETLVLSALLHRAVVHNPQVSYERGLSTTIYPTTTDPIRCFLTFTDSQENQPDFTPSKSRQRNARVFCMPNALKVGDVLTITRPNGLGSFRVIDVQQQVAGLGTSHDEATVEQVTI